MGETLRSGCPIQARAHRAKAISITFRDGSEPFPSPNPIRNQPFPIDLCDCSDTGHGFSFWFGGEGPRRSAREILMAFAVRIAVPRVRYAFPVSMRDK